MDNFRPEPIAGHVLVCTVGGAEYYGNKLEAVAAQLKDGDRIIFNGSEEIVDYVWFYEGPIIKLKGGGSVFPALGNLFDLVLNTEETCKPQNP